MDVWYTALLRHISASPSSSLSSVSTTLSAISVNSFLSILQSETTGERARLQPRFAPFSSTLYAAFFDFLRRHADELRAVNPLLIPADVRNTLAMLPASSVSFLGDVGLRLYRTKRAAMKETPPFPDVKHSPWGRRHLRWRAGVLSSFDWTKLVVSLRRIGPPPNVAAERSEIVTRLESKIAELRGNALAAPAGSQNSGSLPDEQTHKTEKSKTVQKEPRSRGSKKRRDRKDNAVAQLEMRLKNHTDAAFADFGKYRAFGAGAGIFTLPAWDRAAALLVRSASAEWGPIFVGLCRLVSAAGAGDDTAMRTFCKDLATWGRHWGSDAVGIDWRYLTNLESMAGPFFTVRDPDSVREDLRDWFLDVKPHAWFGDEELFYAEFSRQVDVLLGDLPMPDWLTLDEWIREPDLWLTSGGGAGAPRITSRGKVKRGKPAALLGMTINEVKALIESSTASIASVFVKNEPGKERLVTSDSLGSFLNQSYVMGAVERALRGQPWSTMWMGKRQTFQFRDVTVQDRVEATTVATPLDQSKFDHYVTKRMVMIIADTVARVTGTWGDVGAVARRVVQCLRNSQATVEFEAGEKETFGLLNGNLSGWRWTSFINTVCNVAQCRALAALSGVSLSGWLCALGDDTRAAVRNFYQAELLFAAYAEAGFQVNVAKTFAAVDEDEFEKRIARGRGSELLGLPLRVAGSILWRKPWRDDLPRGLERLREVLETWVTFVRRMGPAADRGRCYDLMLDDLSHASGASVSDVRLWVHTPASFGGGGLQPYGGQWLVPEYTSLDQQQLPEGVKLVEHLHAARHFAARTVMPPETSAVFRAVRVVDPGPTPVGHAGVAGGLRPEWLHPLKVTTNQLALLQFRDSRDWAELPVAPSTLAIAKTLRTRASWRVVDAYLAGKLTLATPPTYDCSTDRVGFLLAQFEDVCLARFLRLWRPTMAKWDQLSYAAEVLVPHLVAQDRVRYLY